MKQIKATFQYFCDEKKLFFELDLSPDLPGYIYTDENRLRIIFVNIINNAVKFTKKGGITVGAKLDQEDVIEFWVSDTGVGISDEDQRQLFKMYGRVE